MEAIDRLTGGVAHDFNNLLAAIVGNIELAVSRTSRSHPAARNLRSALASAQRGAKLIQHLLAFARRQTLRPEILNLNGQITASLAVLHSQLGADITVEADLAPELWRVRVDPGQLETAILNLAFNARDAMPCGGLLRIQTRNVTLTGDTGPENLRGDFVALTLRDTGIGITPEHLERVFEPFFTTKQVGGGSGLGLSMVHGFARQSAGSVIIQSTVALGTAVTLYLPRMPEGDHAATCAPPAWASQHGLFPTDDAPRSTLSHMLRQLGYGTTSARDTTETAMLIPERKDA
jgi:signal transduction histidine kinase